MPTAYGDTVPMLLSGKICSPPMAFKLKGKGTGRKRGQKDDSQIGKGRKPSCGKNNTGL